MKPVPKTEAKLSVIGGLTGSSPAGGSREPSLVALNHLTERLTAVTNYLEAALRLFEIDAGAAGVALRLKEIVEKAFGQVLQADVEIKRLRRLLDQDARTAPPPFAGE